MHLAGMLAGLLAGLCLFARLQSRKGAQWSPSMMTNRQRAIAVTSVLTALILVSLVFAALLSRDHRNFYRSCESCEFFNCLPLGWDCCSVISEDARHLYNCEESTTHEESYDYSYNDPFVGASDVDDAIEEQRREDLCTHSMFGD